MTENDISKQIVDTAYKIQTTFGPGLLESVYETLMACEPTRTGLHVVRQQAIPVVYESVHMELGFRADLIVEGKVVVDRVRRDGGARSQEAIADSLAPC